MLGLGLFLLLASGLPLVVHADLNPLRVLAGGLAIFAALALVGGAAARASSRRFRPDSEEGLSALARGELERAARIDQPWTRRGASAVRCVARHDLAVVRARQGDLDSAIALLDCRTRQRRPRGA